MCWSCYFAICFGLTGTLRKEILTGTPVLFFFTLGHEIPHKEPSFGLEKDLASCIFWTLASLEGTLLISKRQYRPLFPISNLTSFARQKKVKIAYLVAAGCSDIILLSYVHKVLQQHKVFIYFLSTKTLFNPYLTPLIDCEIFERVLNVEWIYHHLPSK